MSCLAHQRWMATLRAARFFSFLSFFVKTFRKNKTVANRERKQHFALSEPIITKLVIAAAMQAKHPPPCLLACSPHLAATHFTKCLLSCEKALCSFARAVKTKVQQERKDKERKRERRTKKGKKKERRSSLNEAQNEKRRTRILERFCLIRSMTMSFRTTDVLLRCLPFFIWALAAEQTGLACFM